MEISRALVVLDSHIRATLNQHFSNIEVSIGQCEMPWTRILVVPGIHIRAILNQRFDDGEVPLD